MAETDVAGVQIRSAHQRDLPAIAQLIEPFVRERKLMARTEQELQALLPHGFVAQAADRVVAFTALEVYSRKIAEIQCLAVRSDYQGRGVGTRLVQCCVERARQLKVREVMAITSSEAFLQACGFDFALPEQRKALFLQISSD